MILDDIALSAELAMIDSGMLVAQPVRSARRIASLTPWGALGARP